MNSDLLQHAQTDLRFPPKVAIIYMMTDDYIGNIWAKYIVIIFDNRLPYCKWAKNIA